MVSSFFGNFAKTLEGVHVGHIPNTATLFSGAAVRKFLFENGLGQVIETSLGDFESSY
jgi:hypothetical protein